MSFETNLEGGKIFCQFFIIENNQNNKRKFYWLNSVYLFLFRMLVDFEIDFYNVEKH